MKNPNTMTITEFCRIMGADKDTKHVINSRLSQLARIGKVKRVRNEFMWEYSETDLLDQLAQLKKAADKLPDDVMSVQKFIYERLPLNYCHIEHRIGKRMSEMFIAGKVKRYSHNGRKHNYLYHIADLEREVANLVKLSDKRADKPMVIKTPTKPGIFVRMWRWLFGK